MSKPKAFTLALRRPSWAQDGFAVKVNGQVVKDGSKPGSYVELKRTWKDGDSVALVLPKTLRVEPTPDMPSRVALLWGPLVLAGDLGPEHRGDDPTAVPAFVTDRPVAEWLRPVTASPGSFRASGRDLNEQTRDIDLVPFYRLHRRNYALYWDLYTAAAWKKKLSDIAAERNRQHKLEAVTISFVQPGETQKEKEFNQQGEDSSVDRMMGRTGRRGKKWFSFDLPVESDHPISVIATYFSEERGKRTFEILADGQRIGEQAIERSPPGSATGNFFEVEYKVPAEVAKDKKKVTVRFQATGKNEIVAVYGVRLIRADAAR